MGALVVLLGAAAFAARTPHVRSLEDACFFLLFLREDASTFAPGFSESAFDRVQLGMSEAEVVTLLGEPLVKHGYGNRYWRYSTAPPDRNYFLRVITFDNGIVSSKSAYYFVD